MHSLRWHRSDETMESITSSAAMELGLRTVVAARPKRWLAKRVREAAAGFIGARGRPWRADQARRGVPFGYEREDGGVIG
jgi:hypothetical protein